MRRPGYREAIEWAAALDNPGACNCAEDCETLLTAAMISDIFEVPAEKVGADIWRANARNISTSNNPKWIKEGA